VNTSQRKAIADSLRDPEYREAFLSEHLRRSLPAQIRRLREHRGWSQEQLGMKCGGKKQEWISRLESPSYGKFTLGTLLRLANAFDVGLTARFLPFSELLDWYTSRGPNEQVPSFTEDESLFDAPIQTSVRAVREQNFVSALKLGTSIRLLASPSTGVAAGHSAQYTQEDMAHAG